MKLISIVGSPHGKKGSTARLMDEVLKGATSAGAENETIVLKGDTVLPCRGCDVCHIKGACVQKDDFVRILGKINASDGLILGSPNYIFTVSAQLKAFMDRCCGVLHCQSFTGKYGVSVVTSGGGDEEPIASFMNHFLISTGIVPVGSVWATMGMIQGDEFPEDIQHKAFDLGRNLVDAFNRKIIPQDVKTRMDDFHQRMKNLIMYRKDEWPFEYDYWLENHPG
ncbi:MAG: flavodoxin family protein [Proteobacteria bacterium]|nr:flavodoxin family protein [Pseudomonadota bacterium]